MPRETKAQRLEREEAERAARNAELAATYPQRLMAMLERATKHNFDLEVREGKFVLTDRDDPYEYNVELSLEYSEKNQYALDDLKRCVEVKEQADIEQKRKQALRANALSKLTAEEREELGL